MSVIQGEGGAIYGDPALLSRRAGASECHFVKGAEEKD